MNTSDETDGEGKETRKKKMRVNLVLLPPMHCSCGLYECCLAVCCLLSVVWLSKDASWSDAVIVYERSIPLLLPCLIFLFFSSLFLVL